MRFRQQSGQWSRQAAALAVEWRSWSNNLQGLRGLPKRVEWPADECKQASDWAIRTNRIGDRKWGEAEECRSKYDEEEWFRRSNEGERLGREEKGWQQKESKRPSGRSGGLTRLGELMRHRLFLAD
ncbi:hypothetical protein BDW66DRAFT_60558 [Aspergillus desertorum]